MKRYLESGEWRAYRRERGVSKLDGLEEWLAEKFRCHRGNADVVRQDLEREHGLKVSLRTVERAVAPLREHGTTGEAPQVRFVREEEAALQPLAGRPPFRQVRALQRRVQSDCCVEVDTNAYSVPWQLLGETVRVVVAGGRICIEHRGQQVAVHAEAGGRRQRVVEAVHLAGLVPARPAPAEAIPPAAVSAELLRPLDEYERLLGGGW